MDTNVVYFHFVTNFTFVGLLTVDPKQRLKMSDLLHNEWIQGTSGHVYPDSCLMTPGVLAKGVKSLGKFNNAISNSHAAFHAAQRTGFKLQEVTNARLAQRRKNKNSRSSSSSESSRSSAGSLTPTRGLALNIRNSPMRNLSSNSSQSNASSAASTGFVPMLGPSNQPSKLLTNSSNLEGSGIFSFGEQRIAALSATLTPSPHRLTPPAADPHNNNRDVGGPTISTAKRKLDVGIDDDDCVIVEEIPQQQNPSAQNSMVQESPAKRPRNETIVLE